MATIYDYRRENLRRLAQQWGGVGSLAKKLGYSNASFLVQQAGPNPTRPITEKSARKIEQALNLPAGWMDRPPEKEGKKPENHTPNVDLVSQVVSLCAAICEDIGVRLSPAKLADVVVLVYEEAAARGSIDQERARRIVQLAR